MQKRKLAAAVSGALMAGGLLAVSGTGSANEGLIETSKDPKNWVMQTKDYGATHYSEMDQINVENVHHLKVAWTFSTGTLHGHEGAPLVADGIMYVHTPFPNNVRGQEDRFGKASRRDRRDRIRDRIQRRCVL